MNKFTLAGAVAAAMLALAPAAHAEWYAGLGYTQYDYDGGDLGGVTGRLGYRVNPNFAVEGEASTGVEGDNGVDLNYNAGAYAVGIVPVTQSFDVFGRVGYQTTEVDTPFGDADDDGLGYGVGATWRPQASRFGVRADYTRFDGDEEADTFSLSGTVNF